MTKASKNKPTRIEKVLPLRKIVEFFHQRFHDPYLNPEAEVTRADLKAAFPDVSDEDLDEALSHWVMHPRLKVLSTKTTLVDGHECQVWFVHGLHEEQFSSDHEGQASLRA
ncbi:MAG TPA: hypothetical protein VFE96_07510 [Candidatus Bathyarchaeia archaeon]|nr:hypothetical protein [Candidatus Bathyarchaeia archaeon]